MLRLSCLLVLAAAFGSSVPPDASAVDLTQVERGTDIHEKYDWKVTLKKNDLILIAGSDHGKIMLHERGTKGTNIQHCWAPRGDVESLLNLVLAHEGECKVRIRWEAKKLHTDGTPHLEGDLLEWSLE